MLPLIWRGRFLELLKPIADLSPCRRTFSVVGGCKGVDPFVYEAGGILAVLALNLKRACP